MKQFQFLSLLAGLLMGSLFFVACGDDDDDNATSSNPLVGTWVMQEGNEYHQRTITFVFNSNGTFTQTMEMKAVQSEEEWFEGSRTSGTYTYTDTKLILTTKKYEWQNHETGEWEAQDNDEEYVNEYFFSISGKQLSIKYSEQDEYVEVYTKK
ncbi:MAG: hypothetical protein J5486_09525 [Bacteroidaceae bacterium]|nr:hypothetical protein [Bacteroidaceae bacterium]